MTWLDVWEGDLFRGELAKLFLLFLFQYSIYLTLLEALNNFKTRKILHAKKDKCSSQNKWAKLRHRVENYREGREFSQKPSKKITHFHGKLTFHNRLSTSRGRGGERVKQPVKVTNIATSTHTHTLFMCPVKSLTLSRERLGLLENKLRWMRFWGEETPKFECTYKICFTCHVPPPLEEQRLFSQKGPLFLDKLNCSMMWLVSRLNRFSGLKKGKMKSYP